ncbi:hypothetical protein F7734_02030 [Scytonema sp. UIC 10036]|uniref:GTPase n=1 Tax=Scytonema sp. UIC 10036 TaxID=2304196 RepID=UPI0012DA6564|nr:GTPase domain-containing protein [Scytonema sp. UIC 10036]MUG91329.1 hypothetical protein [Scytonema sp. UIC 10036]
MAEPIRVLVFGKTGCGKTSMCNTLANLAPEDDGYQRVAASAKGVTFECHTYKQFSYSNDKGKSIDVIITDTIGLHEHNQGTVPDKEAIKRLLEFLAESTKGYNLFIHVDEPRIMNTQKHNYDMFYEILGQRKIPIILVVTKIDGDAEVTFQEWPKENKHYYIEFNYKEIVGACFARSPKPDLENLYKKDREKSKKLVLQAIFEHGQGETVNVVPNMHTLVRTSINLWNKFLEFVGVEKNFIIWNEPLAQMLQEKWGISKQEARERVNNMMNPSKK